MSERSVLDNTYLFGLMWNERGDLLIAAVCCVLCTCSNLAAPVISGYLVEILAGRQPVELYPKLLGGLAVIYTLEPLLGQIYVHRAIRGMERVLAMIRKEVFRVLLMQPISFFDKHGATELSNVLAVELDAIRQCVFGNISRDRGPRALLEAVGSIIVLFLLSWRLAPVLGTVIVFTGIAAASYRQVTRGSEARQSNALLSMTRVASQAFHNVRTVRAFAGENLERERFGLQVDRSYRAGMQFATAKGWLEAANRGSIHASLVMLYALGGWLVSTGLMPLRVLLTGIGFTFSLMYATQGSVNSLSSLRSAASALNRVRSLLNATRADPQVEAGIFPGEWWVRENARRQKLLAAADAAASGNGSRADRTPDAGTSGAACAYPYKSISDEEARQLAETGDVELRNVSFAYPMRRNTPVLRNISLTLKKGTVTALVGRSGAGKSTVASLLARFYYPDSGTITMGGADIHTWSRVAWSDTLALVSQDPVLFTGTIADNISYGNVHATEEQIHAAAVAANADEFIVRLPQGYNTLVGERGQRLSGGQRQRIAIARALLKNAPVLILDEATSSLDNLSEKLVSEAITRLLAGRTVLVIAHRLSTIQRANSILVIGDGDIVERGTHEELVNRGGLYSELVNSDGLVLNSV